MSNVRFEIGDRVSVVAANLSVADRERLGDRVTETGRVIGGTIGGAKLMVQFGTSRGVMLRADQVQKARPAGREG